MNIDRIVIIGFGSIGKKHLGFAQSHCPNASIKVLTRYPQNNSEKNPDGYFTSFAEVVEFKPQLIVIANPASFHLNTLNNIAELDSYILIEKPLSDCLDGIEKLSKLFRKTKSRLLVGYNLRFNSSLIYFKELFNKGVLGKLHSVRSEVGQYLPSWRNEIEYQKSVSAQKSLGGGVLLELSHELDYLIWILGRPFSLTAEIDKVSDLDIDTEDHAILTMKYKDVFSQKKILVNLNLDFIRHDITRRCTLIGDQCSLRWDGIAGIVEKFEPKHGCWVEEFSDPQSKDKSYHYEWCHFIDCALGRNKPLVTAQDGVNVLSIIDAARLSSLMGKRVVINYHEIGKVNE